MITAPPPPTPVDGVPIIPSFAPPSAKDGPRRTESRVTTAPPAPRRIGRMAAMLVIVLLAIVAALGIQVGTHAPPPVVIAPTRLMPSLVFATMRLEGALVRGAPRDWAVARKRPARYGDPMPVQLTSYCLKGTTRRDNYVKQGIVAADPRVFPLGRYIDLYVGRVYYGRFLVDDTGSAIRDAILDIWTPECRDARRFGRRRGTAVLVPRPRGALRDTLLTGRLGGAASH
ncbi:MAG: 3D domain-containing protein [Gemmatimonadaceae bacterium]